MTLEKRATLANLAALAFAAAAALAGCASGDERDAQGNRSGPAAERARVRTVLSGDMIELESGEVVRYAGMIAPEQGDPFFAEARQQNERYITGANVSVLLRFFGKKDEKGRRFVHVEVPATALKINTLVNTELLQAGLARIDFRTLPEGFERFYEEREGAARAGRIGIWSIPR